MRGGRYGPTDNGTRSRYASPSEPSREGCSGWQQAEFSGQRGRLYLSSEQACDGGVTRASSGIMALVSTNAWIDVRAVSVDGGHETWVTRYGLATLEDAAAVGLGDIAGERRLAVRSARVAAAARPSVDDVIEASERVDKEAVGAWIAEAGMPLDLDADELVRLADAGVPEEVIDMAIAVSYPETFAVSQEPEPREAEHYGGTYRSYPYYDPFFGSLFFSPFYSPYGFYSPYSPYGSRYGFGFGFRRGGIYIPRVVEVDRNRDSGDRVIRGQGYRRGDATRQPTGRRAVPRGTSTTTRSSGGAVRRSSGSSSSGSSTGRKAKRRGGGGLD